MCLQHDDDEQYETVSKNQNKTKQSSLFFLLLSVYASVQNDYESVYDGLFQVFN